MHTHPKFRRQASLFRALSNERRLFILDFLRQRTHTENEIVEEVNIHQTAVSRHLQILLKANLIDSQRIGRSVVFRMSDGQRVQQILGITSNT